MKMYFKCDSKIECQICIRFRLKVVEIVLKYSRSQDIFHFHGPFHSIVSYDIGRGNSLN